ncbi:Lysophospholipase L1 [Singulisphaera sp. GP187]|uniref:SGNH/GDSL hydrolase family protein n=1 Tax=Singulisphaera sp. GP187 TaxID=1882752 RepID=UPI0009259AD9|nr:SGNH/GDSL hydrolase family protein [Singulisphaera sp. GP187]SIO57989.1 Lysophospholipase L1 [Singulisphaera sp. GP187]
MRLVRSVVLLTLMITAVSAREVRAEFALRDGDTVVFLGDSITAARTYGKIVERYTLLRFPGRKVRFRNAGWGGDTAVGGLARLDRDVFAHQATVLIVAYGINDIGWGARADEAHKTAYLNAVRGIVERCKAKNVRVFIGSAAVTAADPDQSETDFLQRMCDEGMAISRSLGEGAIDLQRTMRSIQKQVKVANAHAKDEKEKQTLHAADGIHLNDLGQLAMAYAIIKGLGAPADVSSVVIDARTPALVHAHDCKVSNLKGDATRLEFDRLDEGLPINFGVFGALQFRFIPIPEELNRYLLSVRDLPTGRYAVEADGRGIGIYTNEQLGQGVNIASATSDAWEPGGPWDAQAALLLQVNDARDQVAQARRLTGRYLADSPNRGEIEGRADAINAELEELQRRIARPTAYHFVVRPAVAPDQAK